MKKLILLGALLLLVVGCGSKETDYFKELPQLSFEEVQTKIDEKTTMVVYFGWVDNCSDSANIQNNYFNKIGLKDNPEWLKQIYVVNLDKELPEGLKDHEKRQPMKEQFDVMYSPTIVYYENGEIVSKIEWTPTTSDDTYGINKDVIEEFFTKIPHLQK